MIAIYNLFCFVGFSPENPVLELVIKPYVVIHSVNNFLSACKKLSGFVGNVWAVPFNQEILGKDFFWLLKCSPEMTKFNFFQETMSVRVQVQHFRNYFTQLNIVREKHCAVRRRFFEQNWSKKKEIMVRCFKI